MVWAILSDDQNAAIKELTESQQSDRIVAVIGGAMLDDSVRRALEQRLRPKDGTTDMNNKLFRVGGPLGNTGPKIDLGYQLYMLDKPHRNAMHGLSEIRNLFAHNLSMSFADQGTKMKEASAKLLLHEGITHYPDPLLNMEDAMPELEPTTTPRDRFLVNLKLGLLWLAADYFKHESWSNVPTSYKVAGT